MFLKVALVVSAVVLCGWVVDAKLKGDDCEVCIQFLTKFKKRLAVNNVESKIDLYEIELMKACREARGKDERLCYYIGASDISSYKMTYSITKPMSFSKPVEKICEDLKKKDIQICELKYDKEIDFDTVDLKKLRVKELKKILNNWGEDCRGCVEKVEFIDKINTVKIKHIRTEL